MGKFLPLTAEDRAIFDRLPVGTETEYRFADYMAFSITVDDLAAGGCVFAVARAVHLADAQQVLA
jgi:hypothetical protein